MPKRLALAALALLVAAAACRKEPADSRTVVRYLAAPDVGGFSKEIIADFEKAYPDIRVEMVEGPAAPDTRENMYATSFMAQEDTYDVLYADVAWVPKFAAQGWLRPLDDRFTPEEQAQFLPGDLEGSRYRGKIYRVPTHSDGGMLYYRKDLLDSKGFQPPQTWEELLSQAKALQKPPELWGFVFQGKQYEGLVCAFLELVWGNGGELVDSQGRVRIGEPPAVEALRRLVDAVRKDKISPEGVLTYQEEEARHAFQEGKAVFMRNWPYAWNLAQDEKSPVRGKIGIAPMVHGRGKASAATLGGWGYSLSAFSKNPEAAWKYVRFAASAQSQKTAFLKGGINPTRAALFDDPDVLKAAPHMKMLGRVLAGARPRPVHPSWARISDILQLHVSAALSGGTEPAQALNLAAQEIKVVVDQAR